MAKHSRVYTLDVVNEVPQFKYVRRCSTRKAMDAIQLIARAWEQSLRVMSGNGTATD